MKFKFKFFGAAEEDFKGKRNLVGFVQLMKIAENKFERAGLIRATLIGFALFLVLQYLHSIQIQ